jgi:hypothetical protein
MSKAIRWDTPVFRRAIHGSVDRLTLNKRAERDAAAGNARPHATPPTQAALARQGGQAMTSRAGGLRGGRSQQAPWPLPGPATASAMRRATVATYLGRLTYAADVMQFTGPCKNPSAPSVCQC